MGAGDNSAVVVGGGIGGLSAALCLQDSRCFDDVLLLEGTSRLGGVVASRRDGPFLLEESAESLSRARPSAIELCERLGVELAPPREGLSAPRFAFDGRLIRLPSGLELMTASSCWPLVASPLLRWEDHRLENVARLGKDPPNLADQPPTASAISQLFVAPVNGMQELVGRLVEALDETRIELDAPVSEIARTDGRWQLTVQGRPPIEADAVVVALPVPPTAALIGRLDRQIGSELIEIESTSVATVAMVWRREELSAESLNLSGFLVPERERRLVSWCSVSSVTWEGRSDDDHVAVRALLRGGSELLRWEDDELVSRARTDLRDLLGVEAEPSLVHVVRHPWSLPVFDLHHGERLTRIEERLAEWSGLGLGGSLWQGPGISNVVDAAERAVRKVNADLDC